MRKKCSEILENTFMAPHPVLFRESLHFLVEEEVDGQSVASAVGEDGAQDLAVLVGHFLRHVQQHRVVDFLNVDP